MATLGRIGWLIRKASVSESIFSVAGPDGCQEKILVVVPWSCLQYLLANAAFFEANLFFRSKRSAVFDLVLYVCRD